MKIKTILLFVLCLSITNIFRVADKSFIPIVISIENSTLNKLNLIRVKSNKDLVDIIDFAANKYNLSPEFIIALIQTESGFNKNAISSKGYKGLMQIPQHVPFDANILMGSRIFREKMLLVNGDIEKALCLYKGYKIGSKDGIREAQKVIRIFQNLKFIT